MHRIALFLVVAALSAAAFVGMPSCITSPDGSAAVDWPRVALELDLASADLADASTLVSDQDLATGLVGLSDLLEQASGAISRGGPPETTVELLERALNLATALVDSMPEDQQGDALAALLIARSTLRRVSAYVDAEVAQ